jgi:hypothetical protein
MRTSCLIPSLCALLLASPFAHAQGPGGPGGRGLSKSADIDDLVSKMMAFDANKDGSLTKAEVTDTRLVGLFNRADVNKDETVTKAELTALAEKEYVAGGGGFGGPGGPGGGFGGPGGPGGPGGRPGEVLSSMVQQRLNLTDAQKAQMAALQKDVDARLEKILDDDQKSQLKQMRERGPGGPPRRGPGVPGN